MKQPIPIDFLNFTSSRRKISTYFTLLRLKMSQTKNFPSTILYLSLDSLPSKTAGNSHQICCINFPSNFPTLKSTPKICQVILKISSQNHRLSRYRYFFKHYRPIIENRKKTGYRYRYRKQFFRVSVPNPVYNVLDGQQLDLFSVRD